MTIVTAIVGLLVLVFGAVAIFSSLQIVEEGTCEALLVFGEMKAVLNPGLNFVPPFVSKTYPIDQRTMTINKGDERVSVPTEFEAAVREAANSEVESPRELSHPTEPGPDSAIATSTCQRIATVFGRTLFVLGAFGLAVPMFMLGHVLEYERWMVSWLFSEATLSQVVLATVLSLSVMVLGEQVGRRYGTWARSRSGGD